jgi:hypothetical protein
VLCRQRSRGGGGGRREAAAPTAPQRSGFWCRGGRKRCQKERRDSCCYCSRRQPEWLKGSAEGVGQEHRHLATLSHAGSYRSWRTYGRSRRQVCSCLIQWLMLRESFHMPRCDCCDVCDACHSDLGPASPVCSQDSLQGAATKVPLCPSQVLAS